MTEVPFKDTSADGLRFHLIEGAVDMKQFTVLSEVELDTANVPVRAGVIGASHFVTFHLGEYTLHEIFACTDVHTDGVRVCSGPLGKVSSEWRGIFFDRYKYRFIPKIVRWDQGLEQLEVMKMRKSTDNRERSSVVLVYEFPRAGEMVDSPVTIVAVELWPDVVVTKTAHAYPNESRIVFTESKLEMLQN